MPTLSLKQIALPKLLAPKRSRLTAVLALVLDGSRLEGLVLRRANGAIQVQKSFAVSLSLDPLTNDPQLVGREIRNHLDAAQIRERQCIVGLPLKWALTTHIEVPPMPEADVAGFLQIEAERNLPCDVETLHLANSRCQTRSGKAHVLVAGIPKNHLAALEQSLWAAKLRPLSFSLGITALQPAGAAQDGGVLALAIGESQVAVQVTSGGGIAALRALEGALELEGGQRVLDAELVAREVRITLGQLPAEVRESVRWLRVFGPRELAQQLVDEMDLRLEALSLKTEVVTRYNANEFGAHLPVETAVSPAFSLAAGALAGRSVPLEFLPPRVTAWQQMAVRYSSGKLRNSLAAAGAAVALLGALFGYQQVLLWRLGSQWKKAEPTVTQLKQLEGNIRQYSPWFDESVRGLAILRGLTQGFPQDGAVTAKTVEIRDLKTVACTGTARSSQALLQTIQRLRTLPQVREVNQGPIRGQAPALQFSFNLVWNERGRDAN